MRFRSRAASRPDRLRHRALAVRRATARAAAAVPRARAGAQQSGLDRERERLAWQIGEVYKLAPGADEWDELEAEHKKLANGQALIDAARSALDAISEADADVDNTAEALTGRAVHALEQVAQFDAQLAATIEVLQGAQAQLQDASHTLASYLNLSLIHI